MSNNSKIRSTSILKFILYAAMGTFMFFVPIAIGGKSTIPIDHLVNLVLKTPNFLPIYGGIVVIIGALLPFVNKSWKKNTTSMIFSFIKLLGIPFIIMAILNRGPAFLMAKNIIPFIYTKIVVPVTTIVPVGSMFLAFLINFGLMEFIGVFMQPVMKPVWKTPGRSAIDAVASFVGSYSLGLLITNKVYQDGKYTAKEAAIVATGFSTVSATFMIIVAKTLGLMHIWLLYFWFTLVVTFIVTAITARIYPLKNKPDEYVNGVDNTDKLPQEGSIFGRALHSGITALDKAPTLVESIVQNFVAGIKLAFAIGPTLMSVGVIGVVLAEYTPVFDYLGYIFYPFLLLVQIPEAALAGKAVSLSIAEMFLPALLVKDAHMTLKFLVAVVSVSEILFFSASIPCILSTDIPFKFSDYLIIWFERVVISILVAAPLIHLLSHWGLIYAAVK